MACRAAISPGASVKLVPQVEVYPSIAWVRTSMPVSAVIFRGILATMTGSRMATSGIHSVVPSPTLRWNSVSVRTMAQVASEPVPLVVGMAIRRAFSLKLYVSEAIKASGSRSGRASIRIMALAASRQEPPPTPMTQLGWY